MTEKQVISKLRELRQIKPKKDWVFLTRAQILGSIGQTLITEQISTISSVGRYLRMIFQYKPTYAGLVAIFIFFGLFEVSQNSLPGDFLYPIKKITERGQTVFVSEEEKPSIQLKLVNERLEDLTKAPAKNLAPAINEFQTSVSRATKEITKIKKLDIKKIAQEAKKLEENKQKVVALGVVIGETEELDNALVQLVEREIKDLEKRTLTEEQEQVLAEAKKDFENGNYSQALIKILNLSQNSLE